jgi:multiple sugar transport system substrate-binding protein
MKKTTIIVFLMFGLSILLSSCNASEKEMTGTSLDPKNPVLITLWHYYVGDNKIALENLVDRFNQTLGVEKGVIVVPEAKGSVIELEDAITKSANGVINSEPMPDVFSAYPDKAFEIRQLGKLCDLSAFFSEDEKLSYVKEFLEEGMFDDTSLFIIPVAKSTELLYVNATSWREFTASSRMNQEKLTTWEGVYEVARAYYQWTDAKTPEKRWDGKSFLGFDSVANFIIVGNHQFGCELIDSEKQQVVLDRAILRKLFDSYYTGMSLGYFNAVGKFRSDDIKTGDLVAYVGSSSGAVYFPTWIEQNNQQLPIELLPLPYPNFNGENVCAIQQGAGMCVTKSTPKEQEGAVEFLKWFTAEEQNLKFTMTTGYMPVQSSAYQTAKFDEQLSKLETGDRIKQNVASVYGIVSDQVIGEDTYAVRPFEESYEVRILFQDTLIRMAESGRNTADSLKHQGMSENKIVAALDLDACFDQWMNQICKNLDSWGVSYSEKT